MTTGTGPERRYDTRIEVYAQAELRGDDVQLLEVRNLSAGGVYLVGTPREYPELRPGLEFELTIFGIEDGAADGEEIAVRCRARVIRIDAGFPGKRPPGFGVTLDPLGQDERERMAVLLARAGSYRAGSGAGRPAV